MACADISQRGPKERRLQCLPTTTESAAPAKAARIGKAGGAAASEGRASYRRLSVPCAVATCRKTLGWQSALACRCGPCAKNVRSPHLATNRHVKKKSSQLLGTSFTQRPSGSRDPSLAWRAKQSANETPVQSTKLSKGTPGDRQK